MGKKSSWTFYLYHSLPPCVPQDFLSIFLFRRFFFSFFLLFVSFSLWCVHSLMLRFCQNGPIVCVVDDLIYLDRSSWDLLLSLHRHCRKLLLVMATEPMKRSFMAALRTEVPKVFFNLFFLCHFYAQVQHEFFLLFFLWIFTFFSTVFTFFTFFYRISSKFFLAFWTRFFFLAFFSHCISYFFVFFRIFFTLFSHFFFRIFFAFFSYFFFSFFFPSFSVFFSRIFFSYFFLAFFLAFFSHIFFLSHFILSE